MLIGNRLFPYPTLNRNTNLTEFADSTFSLDVKFADDGSVIMEQGNVLLKDVKFLLSNATLQSLFDHGKVKCALIVECSSALYRESFNISDIPKDIRIPINDLKGNIVVSSYMYANEDFDNYSSDKFTEDYKNYSFKINKFDILAIDDGFRFNLNIDVKEDNKLSSIFLIIKKEENTDIVTYEKTSNKINIYLSKEHYSNYDSVKNNSSFNNIFFSMLVIPVLSNALQELQAETNECDDLDEVVYQYKWFKAICIGYEKVKGKELTLDVFRDLNCLELSQLVLNNATCNGMKNFCEFILNGSGGEEEDE